MLVHLRRAGAVTLLGAVAAVLPASCATNDSSIFVVGCVQVARDSCTAELSTTTVINYQGLIDADYVKDYNCLLLVENQMVPEGNATTQRTETSGVQLTDAEVQVFDPSAATGAAPLAQFSVPITGYIPPGAGGQPGIGGTQVVLVDPATIATEAAKIAASPSHDQQLVVASVILHGNTLGGLSIATGEFRYPVTISAGSSCYVPAGSTCVTSNATAVTDCRLGLDEPTGTNCQLIAAIGPCGNLECTQVGGKSDIASAHCPVHIPPDNSCCTP